MTLCWVSWCPSPIPYFVPYFQDPETHTTTYFAIASVTKKKKKSFENWHLADTGRLSIERRLLVVHLWHRVCPVRVPEVVKLQPDDGPGYLTEHSLEEPAHQLEGLEGLKWKIRIHQLPVYATRHYGSRGCFATLPLFICHNNANSSITTEDVEREHVGNMKNFRSMCAVEKIINFI